jgi:hypothetical protein
MTSNDGQRQIRGDPSTSSYFQGGYRAYGRYQWSAKWHGWEDFVQEVEAARAFFFGEYIRPDGHRGGYTELPAIVGRKPYDEGGQLISSGFDGRSGGWFVVDEELTDEELEKLDRYIHDMMHGGLKQFLEDERAFHRQEKQEAEEEERTRRRQILGDPRLQCLVNQLRQIAEDDFVLIVHGIDVVKTLEETFTDPEKAL